MSKMNKDTSKWKPSTIETIVWLVLGVSVGFAFRSNFNLAMLVCFWCSLILSLQAMKK